MRGAILLSALISLGSALAVNQVAFEGNFEPSLADWTVKNHGSYADLVVKDYAGVRNALVITRKLDVTKGTAWEVRGEKFAVMPGERLRIVVRARGTVSGMRCPSGYLDDNYLTAIRWFDASGAYVKERRRNGFGLEVLPTAWHYSFVEFEAPQGAVSACVSLGADRPDFASDDVLAISAFRVERIGRAEASKCRGVVTSLRNDGTVLKDGKPFLPIGVYTFRKVPLNGNDFERGLRQLMDVGFNSFDLAGMYDEPTFDSFMTLCERMGAMVFFKPVRGFGEEIYDSRRLRKYLDHPSILCWYLADDTSSYAVPEEVDYRRRVCAALDGGRHLSMQADGVYFEGVNRYRPYVHTTNVFMPELYPCRAVTTNGLEVAEVVRDMHLIRWSLKDSDNPAKSIWPILQCFEGWDNWKRFPSPQELRAMTWATFALGAKGLMWYAYSSSNPDKNHCMSLNETYFKWVADITREVKSHEESLLAYDAPRQPEVKVVAGPQLDGYGSPSISCLLKGGTKPLLIAVNSTTNCVSATFTYGKRTFRHDFEPLGVLIR